MLPLLCGQGGMGARIDLGRGAVRNLRPGGRALPDRIRIKAAAPLLAVDDPGHGGTCRLPRIARTGRSAPPAPRVPSAALLLSIRETHHALFRTDRRPPGSAAHPAL